MGSFRATEEAFALLQRGEGKYIRKSIRLGIHDGDRVEILDGLFPGDQIVTTGNHVLFSLFGGADPTANPAPDKKQDPVDSKPSDAAYTQDRPSQAIVAQGVVEVPTDRKAFAGSRIEGRVGRILVQHSQHVKTGDVLAEVDSLELRNVQGDLLETEARLSWTDQRLEAITPLAEQKVIAQTELQKLQTDQRVLVAKRDSLLRQLSMIGVSDAEVDRLRRIDLSAADCKVEFVRSIPIRAAIDGTIASFTLVPGQVVNNESQLFEIQNTSTVWVRGHLFQQDAIEVREGQSVPLTFAALPDTAVSGKVVRVSPVLEATERVLPVWVEVNNLNGRLIEGMWARMEIDAGAKPLAQAASGSSQ